jgi:hypothetical protein
MCVCLCMCLCTLASLYLSVCISVCVFMCLLVPGVSVSHVCECTHDSSMQDITFISLHVIVDASVSVMCISLSVYVCLWVHTYL